MFWGLWPIYKIILRSRRRRQTLVITGGWALRKSTVGMQFQTNISKCIYMVIVSNYFILIGSWFQIYNSRSSNIRTKATSPSCFEISSKSRSQLLSRLSNTSGPLCFRSRCVNCPQYTATKVRLVREWCCTSIAPQSLHGYKNSVARTRDRYLRDSTLSRPHNQASWLYTMTPGQGNIDN